ncbi:hypothetical protein [Alteromonas sp. BMJM2]|uniref:hypothetical protein n=1 Tax=Alteromonas sp. BMJM2 TaxID=2954241 RepID=UPI0022B5CCA9|nr:hypothetical protein [Alteromonas sp. BMJM2]
MEILVAVISLLVFGVFLAVAVALSRVPVLGNALDFFAELASGPRFVYLAWPFLLSTAYRKELIFEHRNRIKWLAWVEYILATIVFLAICAIGLLIIHHNVKRLLLQSALFE